MKQIRDGKRTLDPNISKAQSQKTFTDSPERKDQTKKESAKQRTMGLITT
jgi:hypothetical protein